MVRGVVKSIVVKGGRFCACLSCLWTAASACSSTTTNFSGGNECPDLSGTWKAVQHYDADQVGVTTEITQDGCTIEMKTTGVSEVVSSVVSSDGRLSWKMEQWGLTCVGQAENSNSITMDCVSPDGGGKVVLERK